MIGHSVSSLLISIYLYLRPVGCPNIPCSSCTSLDFYTSCLVYPYFFPYSLNGHYSRICLAQFHIGYHFESSRVVLELDIFTFWGIRGKQISLVLVRRVCWIYHLGRSRYPELTVPPFSWLLTLLHCTLHKARSWPGVSWSHTFIPLYGYMWNSYPSRFCLGLMFFWYWSSGDFRRNSLLWCILLHSRRLFSVPTLVCICTCCSSSIYGQ